MALDGITLTLLKAEFEKSLLGGRVDKIHQPTKEEIIIAFRSIGKSFKLLISTNAATARVQLTNISVENPASPPMFCMLMRKWLSSAKLVAVRQPGYERALFFDFETQNEFGDIVTITLAAEIMGRYSNLALIGSDGRVIDCLKRVGADLSSLRQLLPGLTYEVPPPQQKLDLLKVSAKGIVEAMRNSSRDIDVAKLLQEIMGGLAPIVAREVIYKALKGCSAIKSQLTDSDYQAIENELDAIKETLIKATPSPTVVFLENKTPKDFCFMPIEQYENSAFCKGYETISQAMDAFYGEKSATDRMKQKMSDFSRVITSRIERIERKLMAQKEELLACQDRDQLRKTGDLLSSSIYQLEKGMTSVTLQDYFQEECPEVTIKLDPRLTPVQNVQHYYKEYRRADTAEKMLKELILKGEQELEYLDAVYDSMVRAKSEAELAAIRSELSQSGYVRVDKNAKRKQPPKLPPLKYRSSDGFLIYSGRNNLQNEALTLKESRNNDMWFHTQKQAGSHVIVVTEGKELPDRTYTEAAMIAAFNSKAQHSSQVAVDYTAIKNVKKQPGGKPGMVIYDSYYTAIVTPDEDIVKSLVID